MLNNQFELVDESVFLQYTEPKLNEESINKYNYCLDCALPMVLSGSEYQCSNCGLTRKNELDPGCKDHDETVSGSIRITTGANRGRFYNTTADYTKTQYKMILDQLMRQSISYKGNAAFPINILKATATQYNLIQKIVTEDDIDENGNVRGQKKFVRRGSIKDEVLAAILYFECIRENLNRKKKDIAKFMNLVNQGFARGEDIVRNLAAEGKIELPPNEEPINGFIERYLEYLGLENPTYNNFISDLVMESELKKIGMTSQLSSKVVGAIWILIKNLKLNIGYQELEKAADNTKKNTFIKFCKAVDNNMNIFNYIFIKYNIPI